VRSAWLFFIQVLAYTAYSPFFESVHTIPFHYSAT